jgi:glutathione S-transferase
VQHLVVLEVAGLQAIETLLAEHSSSGVFCHGERPTIADICLVTQVTPAKTFDLPLKAYPRVMRVYDNLMASYPDCRATIWASTRTSRQLRCGGIHPPMAIENGAPSVQ